MSSDPEQPSGPICQWCHGAGAITRLLAYVPGPDPFHSPAETLARAGQCKHCQGAGVYTAALDPTLEPWRRRDTP
ncbi:hypothetical protein GL263_26705 [Streptomyces durbertensis]|uniref:Uncharacterized protein n=1 Tax=Streptomyces durbertensis TaxID=2448886 RepID=A0ABR6EQ88_9ACTN|nr:hypothetical protein [Streptomyces durbertensis]MBB1247110.1 hypothetical protein [Streptomyces durbertensis]